MNFLSLNGECLQLCLQCISVSLNVFKFGSYGWEAHKRPAGISDEACKGAKLPDDFDWDTAVTITTPSPVNIGNLRPLNPGKGGGGKGKGKGKGAGGKGKGGGGKGKGGGGKGKGKGGRGGGPPFGRQRY